MEPVRSGTGQGRYRAERSPVQGGVVGAAGVAGPTWRYGAVRGGTADAARSSAGEGADGAVRSGLAVVSGGGTARAEKCGGAVRGTGAARTVRGSAGRYGDVYGVAPLDRGTGWYGAVQGWTKRGGGTEWGHGAVRGTPVRGCGYRGRLMADTECCEGRCWHMAQGGGGYGWHGVRGYGARGGGG